MNNLTEQELRAAIQELIDSVKPSVTVEENVVRIKTSNTKVQFPYHRESTRRTSIAGLK